MIHLRGSLEGVVPLEPLATRIHGDDPRLVERVGMEFLRALRTDPSTSMAMFAERVPERLREELKRELVRRHAEFRRERGQAPREEDYAEFLGTGLLELSQAGVFDAGDSCSQICTTVEGTESYVSAATSAHHPEQMLGRYRLEAFLGSGAFGSVWRARDTGIEQDVAVKLLRPDRLSGEMVERFRDEARRQGKLREVPGVVRLYDVGEQAGTVFLVTQFVPGGTLKDRLPDLSRGERLRIVGEVARCLHRAHQKGVVHRDVKPANILLDAEGHPLLTDFGIAATEQELFVEPVGTVVGTYAYMSPEQIDGRANLVDPRSDVYSLGVLLYECLVGERPFAKLETSRSTLQEAVMTRTPWPPRSRDATIPADVEAVCLKCLARNAEDRYSSAGDVAAALVGASLAGRRRWLWTTAAVVGGVAVPWAVLAWSGIGNPGDDSGSDDKSDDGSPETSWPVREIVFPGDLASTWSSSEDGSLLKVHADGLSLLSLGEYQGGEMTLDFDVRDLDGKGRVGLFFGHANDSSQGNQRRFQTVELLSPDSRNGHLRRVSYSYLRSRPGGSSADREWRSANLQTERRDGGRLTLRFIGNELVEVSRDGVPVPRLTPDEECPSVLGAFGVFVLNARAAIVPVGEGQRNRFVRAVSSEQES